MTKLIFYECTNLAALPAAIGELGALTYLSLYRMHKPRRAAGRIGGLGALTTLNLSRCSSLARATGRDRRAQSADGARLAQLHKLAALPDAIGGLGALTELTCAGARVSNCGAIGELKALTELNLYSCSSLAALPDAISELGAPTTLNLNSCASLVALVGRGRRGAPRAPRAAQRRTRLDRLEASVRADPSARAGVEERLAGLEHGLAKRLGAC